jgi:ParB family transcriptional regulator, chromosome partitioning protein
VAQKNVLGKGLASLLPGANSAAAAAGPSSTATHSGTTSSHAGATRAGSPTHVTETENKDRHMGISLASIEDLEANHLQPRRDFDDTSLHELAQSIKTSGIIQPLVVRKNAKGGLELIAGERRLRAAKIAGLKHVPIVIRRSTDKEALELALIENIQRQNLNCVDEALAYFQLIQDFSLTQEEVADRVGKDRATVANYLRLLRLPPAIIDDLKKQILSFGHGKALLGLDDADMRLRARAQIIENRMSVRETEALVESMKNAAQKTATAPEVTPKTPIAKRLANLAQELTRFWSAKVEVKGSEKKGKIVIHYTNRQELDRIIEGMQPNKV